MENGVLIMEPGSLVTLNKAAGGAGVNLSFSTFTMRGGVITANTAIKSAGGLSANGSTVEMSNGAKISGNTVGAENDTVGDNAGGVGLSFSTLTMHQGSKISGNKVYSGYGGGLYVTGESTLIMEAGSEISDNECTIENGDSNAGWGGGLAAVWRSSIVMETGSMISGNTAYTAGGGIHMRRSTSLTIRGGDISGNMAGESSTNTGWGGGLYLMEGASFTMAGGSIAGNTAGVKGGGVYVVNGTASFIVDGGTIYGKSPADTNNKNIAKSVSDSNTGHAIYDARPATPVPYDDVDISVFPIH
jgi:hypothetical protein